MLGPSGSGKTTLLRCLAGFEALDAGEDQHTRKRLPVLPVLADTVDRRRRAAAALIAAAEHTRPGHPIPDTARALRKAVTSKAAGQ
ncbi:ATP-binding cassette domain-containing protein [Streptomyces sp. NPDC007808]|uniref:ATP-binding cassette domain-containing protein n=1 Tax=Streptomyces sp. NPDC007808 TaxID=3364779 RepID=UPI0036A833AE